MADDVKSPRAEAGTGPERGRPRQPSRRPHSRRDLRRQADPVMIAVEPNRSSASCTGAGLLQPPLFRSLSTATGYDVLPRDVQLDPVSGQAAACRLPALRRRHAITVQVPVHFENEDKAPGIKRGGVLNVVLHEIDRVHQPATIPEYLRPSTSTGLEIGHCVHLRHWRFPRRARGDARQERHRRVDRRTDRVREAAAAAAAEAAARRSGSSRGAAPAAGCGSRGGRAPRRVRLRRRVRGFRRPAPRPGSGQEVEAGSTRRTFDASAGRARQSRAELCGAPAQCRLHGGGRDRPPPWLRRRGARASTARSAEGHLGGETHAGR